MKVSHVLLVVVLFVWSSHSAPPTDSDWTAAINKAKAFIQPLSNADKANIATGVGWQGAACVGNTYPVSNGFAGFCLEDSPTGVRFADNSSAFPAAVNAASTWNRALIYNRAAAMGAEFKGKGVNVALAPMMNIGRVAAGGRNWEGFGADPYLAGEAAFQTVLGIQDQGVIACAKHYILNEQEHFRTTSTSNIDDRTLHEVYLWPFLQSVNAGVGSIMCSYNQVNGVYACENQHTLNEVLKGELKFRGYVMSDWAATMSGIPSILAGLDMTMPGDITFNSGTTYFGPHLVESVNNKSIAQSRLDDMVTRIMTPYFLLGQDSGYPAIGFDFRNASVGPHTNVQADHAQVIRQIGRESNILLKNTGGVLPFTTSISGGATYTFALIGTDAGPAPGGPNSCSDHGCNIGHLAQGWGSGTSIFPYLVTPLDGITNRAQSNSQTVVSFLNDTDTAGAASVAASADIAIVFVTADSGEGYITVEGNEGDRNDLSLWHNGDNLITAVAAANTRTVVVLNVVGPVLLPWINNPNIAAVVLSGLPGQESGNALADVLFGDYNPSGKLVYTIAKNAADYSAQVVYTGAKPPGITTVTYSEALLVDYRYFDQNKITPAFPFGFGLSYTTFTYSNLVVTKIADNGPSTGLQTILYHVVVDINNVGSYDGTEVAQLYLAFPPTAGEPPKILRGFDKVIVAQGQTGQAQFDLTKLDVSVYDVGSKSWLVPGGAAFQVLVGSSSANILQNSTISPIPSPIPSSASTISLLLANLFVVMVVLATTTLL